MALIYAATGAVGPMLGIWSNWVTLVDTNRVPEVKTMLTGGPLLRYHTIKQNIVKDMAANVL